MPHKCGRSLVTLPMYHCSALWLQIRSSPLVTYWCQALCPSFMLDTWKEGLIMCRDGQGWWQASDYLLVYWHFNYFPFVKSLGPPSVALETLQQYVTSWAFQLGWRSRKALWPPSPSKGLSWTPGDGVGVHLVAFVPEDKLAGCSSWYLGGETKSAQSGSSCPWFESYSRQVLWHWCHTIMLAWWEFHSGQEWWAVYSQVK